MAHSLICHVSVLFLRLLSCQWCCMKTLCKTLGRQACSGLRCRNSKWEEQWGGNIFWFFLLSFPAIPSRAQNVSVMDDDDSSESPLLQADAETFHMTEFLKAAVLPGVQEEAASWGRILLLSTSTCDAGSLDRLGWCCVAIPNP